MELIERTLEMRMISRSEIIDYFISMNGEDRGNGRIIGQDWNVEVGEEEPVNLGSLTITAVVIRFRCKRELFEQMYSEFRLKFLRAGG